ncbi:NADH dehydrogenase [ubiquinone] 1 beta subcomplex subunit 7-like [Styela clava]|uniref:NADH dehydrogenase [ubiquinone] 1 beta subcomplex subunit 7-like n=1 Tax=Styela clava TaxID=7725 RepID=UPI00193A5F41|nr:NADH dehydrogenase [ubiquinone] 1 beta subcomplex subunit 7-like [Styela clava]
MGQGVMKSIHLEDEPIDKPEMFAKYKEYGAEDRPVRKMAVTREEMNLGQIPRESRDYCAQHFMAYKKCIREWMPQYRKCMHQLHHYHDCEIEDQIIRRKEYERTKRLMKRDKERARREAREAAAAAQ